MKSPGIKAGQSKYGTGKKQSINSQSSVEVPATPTVLIEGLLPSFSGNIYTNSESSDDDSVIGGVDEEDTPPLLPPPPILPKQPVKPQPDHQQSSLLPLLPIVPPPPKQSFKQLPIIQAVPGMTPIEEEPNKVVPIPVLPPRESVSKLNGGGGMRERAESAPALPPRKPPLVSMKSEGSASTSTDSNESHSRPPAVPPRNSIK